MSQVIEVEITQDADRYSSDTVSVILFYVIQLLNIV
jgi:hypothetical protein